MTIQFYNESRLDPVAITTFGVHVKDTALPIGHFGTGLKYAIAIILRLRGKITIRSHGNEYVFTTKSSVVRNKKFRLVHMNGQPLGFTTELGKNWAPWMAFRELYCNALDEGGDVEELPASSDHETTIVVCCDEIERAYQRRDDIVLRTSPDIEQSEVAIYRRDTGKVYYRNVVVHTPEYRPILTYNFMGHVDLSEDRGAKYPFLLYDDLSKAVTQVTCRGIIRQILLAPATSLEHKLLDFSRCNTVPSKEFLEVAREFRYHPQVNPTIPRTLSRWGEMDPPPPCESLTEVQQEILRRAILFCTRLGYPVDKYPIVVSDMLQNGMMGLAYKDGIYLSTRAFDIGTKYVASTLLEEYMHLSTGHGDMTRALQDHLFNQLVTLGERMLGEPV